MSVAADEAWIGDVLHFWFDELGPAAWFRKDAATDAAIRSRFLILYEVLANWPAAAALASPERALATVLVLDQFPRNLFRAGAQAFATDALAREVAAGAIAEGFDAGFDKDRRLFLYLPFEHSEDKADQARSVQLIASLGDPGLADWAARHKAVVDRFGRFPHRNALLGRASTPEEEAFLKEPGSSF
jgi:uncharacterized protein (DUF924 family)